VDSDPGRDPGVRCSGPPLRARNVIHRVDATLALGTEFTVGEEVALDALHEWMELGSLPQIFEVHP
jgi:hypothetical protein